MTGRIQLALHVGDIEVATRFYASVFGVPPAEQRPGYANFVIADPPLTLVLFENPGAVATLNHLGVEVASTDEVVAATARFAAAGLKHTTPEVGSCCHAVQDKVWVDAATAALKAGVSPKVISERLGHSTVAFTLQTYTHVIPGMDELAADTVAKLILAEPVTESEADGTILGTIDADDGSETPPISTLSCTDLDIVAGQGPDDPESGEWAQRGSNPRPLVCKTRALPLSYTPSKPAQTSERERVLRTPDRVK